MVYTDPSAWSTVLMLVTVLLPMIWTSVHKHVILSRTVILVCVCVVFWLWYCCICKCVTWLHLKLKHILL